MVNLLWGLHLTLYFHAPELAAMSVAIGLGLHWVVYSWIIQHPLGVIHAVLRTGAVVAVWHALPAHRVTAVSFAVVVVYAISLVQMSLRPLPGGVSSSPATTTPG